MIGFALVLRDLVQRRLGLEFGLAAIVAGTALSALVAPQTLVIASAAAFFVSELADFAVYTPLARRRLVLAVRETPLHGGHLRTMTALFDMGAIIAPVVPAFYNKPQTIDDIVNHTVGRLLDLFGIDTGVVKRWQGGPSEGE